MMIEPQVFLGDCLDLLDTIEDDSISAMISDIPYGINLDDWDVLHRNTNNALLTDQEEQGTAFKKRGKPLNGWSASDKNTGDEYEEWCRKWVAKSYPKLKSGAYALIFSSRRNIHHVINAFQKEDFIFRDIISWEKSSAHHRAQQVSKIFSKRNDTENAEMWEGWRIGNLAPMWEPILVFMKSYPIGSTLTDCIRDNEVGAMDTRVLSKNIIKSGFSKQEQKIHEAQKPIGLIETLVKLVTKENQIVLDPFLGSGTTAEACLWLNRHCVGFEKNEHYFNALSKRLEHAKKSKEMSLFL